MTASGEDVESNSVESKKEESVSKEEEKEVGKGKGEVKVNGEIEKPDSEILKEVAMLKAVEDAPTSKEEERTVIADKDDSKPVDPKDELAPKEQRSSSKAKAPPSPPPTWTVTEVTKESEESKDKEDIKEEKVKPSVPEFKPSPSPTSSTKKAIRLETWAKLDSARVLFFSRTCKYLIPRFNTEAEAIQKLSELEVFKKASVVKVILDKAHESIRFQVFEAGKDLVTATAGLREAVFLHMHPPADPNKNALRNNSTRKGIEQFGAALKFDETKVDLVIVGAVAVDRKGRRIGKGEGFSDLEYALLKKLNVIPEDTPIVTVVHDLQVYDSLPDDIFQPFDVPVDFIVTPSQVIEVEPRLPRPSLQWKLLSNRRVNNIPIIKQLLDREKTDGVDVQLKEEDSDIESERRPLPRFQLGRGNRNNGRFVRPMGRRRETSAPNVGTEGGPRRRTPASGRPGRGGGGGGGVREGSAPPPPSSSASSGGGGPRNKSRTFRRKPRPQSDGAPPPTEDNGHQQQQRRAAGDGPNGGADGSEPSGGVEKKAIQRRVRRVSRRLPVDFSIRVDGLTAGIRIRDLKAALVERGVRPRDISWRGTKGIAFLHFSKSKASAARSESATDSGLAVGDVVASLQGLRVKAEGAEGPPADLVVEPASPVTRVEITDVARV